MSNNKQDTAELNEDFIVIAVPANTVELDLKARVWYNGEVVTVARTLPFEEVKEAFKEAEEGYIPSNAVFVLNPDASKSEVERLVQTYIDRAKEGYCED
jgi:hypothetical protein